MSVVSERERKYNFLIDLFEIAGCILTIKHKMVVSNRQHKVELEVLL